MIWFCINWPGDLVHLSFSRVYTMKQCKLRFLFLGSKCMYHDSKMYLFNNPPPCAMPNKFYLSRNCLGSPANKGRSTVNYLQSSAFDCPFYHVILLYFVIFIILWLVTFPINVYYCYHYSLEILLNNVELVFLKFKHFYKTQRTSFFFFLSVIFCSLLRNHYLY